MKYTKEELEEFPSKKLIDIILRLQEEAQDTYELKRILANIHKLSDVPQLADMTQTIKTTESGTTYAIGPGTKRGRKAYTEEEKTAAYERHKQKMLDRYYAEKNKRMEEEAKQKADMEARVKAAEEEARLKLEEEQ